MAAKGTGREGSISPPSIGEALPSDRFTSKEYWNQYWSHLKLPLIAERKPHDAIMSAVLDVFDRFFPGTAGARVLELGGAPGQFLAYGVREYGWEAHALDYSEVGCRMTVENFHKLGLPVVVHNEDLFDRVRALPEYDIVYSLGLIEHFEDTLSVVQCHWQRIKPGGVLLLGVPHFIDVFWPVLKLVAPRTAGGHNRRALILESWRSWEKDLGMIVLHKAYTGGLEPVYILSVIEEERRLYPDGPAVFQGLARFILRCLRALRTRAYRSLPRLRLLPFINGRSTSAFAVGVYQKAASSADDTR
jgi:SAM-dependent methyltransferase